MKVIIEACQFAEKGEIIYLTLDGVRVGLPCETKATMTASYDTVFNSDEFEPDYHGFTGIMNGLKKLCGYVTVEVITTSQLEMDMLVEAGMDATNEPKAIWDRPSLDKQGINVTFSVTPEVAERYKEASGWTTSIRR